MLNQTRPFSPAGGHALRSLFSHSEVQEERVGEGWYWVKVLCAFVDVRDCTPDMSGKEMWADS